MIAASPRRKLWTREEYHRLGELGWFRDARVQLIEGEIVEMSPQKSAHAATVDIVRRTIERAWGAGAFVRTQVPLALDQASEPEPDAAVVPGAPADYLAEHPRTALLVIEVADTSLTYDRTHKQSLYAKHRLPEYWIVNLVDGRLEVYRRPELDDAGLYGYVYAERTVHERGALIEPLLAPEGVRVAVSDLLPAR